MRPGRFKGQKKSDKRFWAPDGEEWASKFEWEVYCGFHDRASALCGTEVRRTTQGDSFAYGRPKRKAECLECGSDKVVQRCTITQDLYVHTVRERYYVEAKGHFPGSRRAAYRDFFKSEAARGTMVRFVLQTNARATKRMTMLEYFQRYFKGVDVIVWDGPASIPESWLQ